MPLNMKDFLVTFTLRVPAVWLRSSALFLRRTGQVPPRVSRPVQHPQDTGQQVIMGMAEVGIGVE